MKLPEQLREIAQKLSYGDPLAPVRTTMRAAADRLDELEGDKCGDLRHALAELECRVDEMQSDLADECEAGDGLEKRVEKLEKSPKGFDGLNSRLAELGRDFETLRGKVKSERGKRHLQLMDVNTRLAAHIYGEVHAEEPEPPLTDCRDCIDEDCLIHGTYDGMYQRSCFVGKKPEKPTTCGTCKHPYWPAELQHCKECHGVCYAGNDTETVPFGEAIPLAIYTNRKACHKHEEAKR